VTIPAPDPLGALVPGIDPAALESGEAVKDGPLSGARLVVKDVIDVAGAVTGAGNPDWAADHEPAREHATSVAALLDAGAELVGKGQCAEFAFSLSGDNAHFGMPRNSAAPVRDPGGSTSGPAAAVAGGIGDLGIGTDTLGSIRVPSSYCGLYGFRPTHGAISTRGAMPLAQSFDTVGILARDPRVLRDAAAVLLGRGGAGEAEAPRRLLVLGEGFDAADPEVAKATRATAERLAAKLGATIEETRLTGGSSPSLSEAMAAFNVLQGAQVWRNFGEWICAKSPSMGEDISSRMERASGYTPDDVTQAEPVAKSLAEAVRRLEPGEAFVIPATGTVAPSRGAGADERQSARVSAGQLTCLATLSGAPAVALPLANVDGAPVGISLVGSPGADASLLAALKAPGSDV
jgi:amidase